VRRLRIRRYDAPRWTGEPLDGKRLLVVAEQGYGDMIQFARFLPMAARCGGRVTLEAPAELLPLFAPLAEGTRLVASDDGRVPDDSFDCFVNLMSLPGIFGIDAATIPGDTPYIAADPARIAAWREKLHRDGAGLKVGLAWAGRPSHPQDAQRSMDSAWLEPLTEVAGAQLYSLQKDISTRPPTAALAGSLAGDFGHLPEDFTETAAIVSALDLVITVDTALAHLAGALGRPVWTLLCVAADWRWMRDRADTPYYPTMRLFRQPEAGDWGTVVARAREALAAACAASGA